jgi:AcrR family transcriptional regulator
VSIADSRRDAVLERLADHVLAHGLAASSLRALARAAKTSDRMLLYYFADKDALVAATLETIAARMMAMLVANAAPAPLSAPELAARLAALVLDDSLWPFMRLWLEIASRAGHGDVFYRAVGGQLAHGFLAWAEAQLTPDARAAAPAIFAKTEGLVVLKALGADDMVRAAIG